MSPRLSWLLLVSAIPTTPKWAMTSSEVSLVERESEYLSRRWSFPVHHSLLGIIALVVSTQLLPLSSSLH
ncbi:hypothetical protein FOQG_19321 [Fusarium oxysporum f. sp. raphani 54005]|uniref:Uncharacterized protein n=1 Tax=Fusarium oxysporum f. sp. raphani 54005 TaxID=1089458 RepID=X0B2D5_FUSOX|nr:hypothetical protein FOQG_19321 [Fusarium oxysporum f. sp. raphani 54005]